MIAATGVPPVKERHRACDRILIEVTNNPFVFVPKISMRRLRSVVGVEAVDGRRTEPTMKSGGVCKLVLVKVTRDPFEMVSSIGEVLGFDRVKVVDSSSGHVSLG